MSTTMTTQAPASTDLPACPSRLTAEHIAQYHRDGFIAFHSVLSPQEIEEAKAGLSNIVERLRLRHRTTNNPYGVVWTSLDSPASIQFQRGHEPDGENDLHANEKVRKFFEFVGTEPYLRYLATEHTALQNIVAGLLGAGSLLSQDMALVNPPGIGTGKPWHQDDAYFKIVPLDAICGVWIALDEAGIENGCMNFLPGWHKRGALRHYHGSDCEIVPDRIAGNEDAVVPVPLPPGGAVFFNGVLPHMTKPNVSTQYRRALQYHYRSADSRFIAQDEYDAIFAESDGTAASCAAASQRGF